MRITQRIQEIITGLDNIRKARDSLKVTCRTIEDKKKLMSVTTLLGHTVIITEPYKKKRYTVKNSKIRGIIFGVNEDISDDEMSISIGMKAERIIKKKFGNTIHTEQMIIYCEGDLPPYVTCGWKRVRVSLYIPEPVRCYRCQQFGHKAQFCRAKQNKCSICSGPTKQRAARSRPHTGRTRPPYARTAKDLIQHPTEAALPSSRSKKSKKYSLRTKSPMQRRWESVRARTPTNLKPHLTRKQGGPRNNIPPINQIARHLANAETKLRLAQTPT